jgi:chromate reductase, NAD(P)H dehydrogenase (quinone)
MRKKIIAFAGSNSSQSINRSLIAKTLKSFAEFDVEFLDINDFEMPIYSFDREQKGGIPEQAHQFRKQMTDGDAIICSLAEHNGNFTAAFKNLVDWCSRV